MGEEISSNPVTPHVAAEDRPRMIGLRGRVVKLSRKSRGPVFCPFFDYGQHLLSEESGG